MSSPNIYPAAFAPSGPDLLTLAGNYLSGSVLWVDSSSSVASDSNAGTEPELPKLTWTSAYAAASAGDTILCAAGHAETISSANTLNTANVTTIGLGLGTSRARFTSAVSAAAMWTPNVAGLTFMGCYFPASTATTTARISIASGGTDCLVRGCFFDCGVNDTTSSLTIAGARAYVRDVDFSVSASRPARGINLSGAVASCVFEDVSFDGGSFGWSQAAFNITAAATLIRLENIRLMNRSDFVATTTGTSYRGFGVRSMDTTGSRIVIAS